MNDQLKQPSHFNIHTTGTETKNAIFWMVGVRVGSEVEAPTLTIVPLAMASAGILLAQFANQRLLAALLL